MFRHEGENDVFQWGVIGTIPTLNLIGAISRAQSDLWHRRPAACPKPALVIAWDQEQRVFHYFVDPAIPTAGLVGMLETIKLVITTTHMSRQPEAQQASPRILGVDGQPMRM